MEAAKYPTWGIIVYNIQIAFQALSSFRYYYK